MDDLAATLALLAQSADPSLRREATLLRGRLARVTERRRAGEVTEEAATVEENRIARAAFELAQRAGPRVTPTETERASLAGLLASLFEPTELTQFLASWTDTARLVPDLPGGTTSGAQLTFAAADALLRHGLVGPTLFERLAAARPGRRADIDAIAHLRQL